MPVKSREDNGTWQGSPALALLCTHCTWAVSPPPAPLPEQVSKPGVLQLIPTAVSRHLLSAGWWACSPFASYQKSPGLQALRHALQQLCSHWLLRAAAGDVQCAEPEWGHCGACSVSSTMPKVKQRTCVWADLYLDKKITVKHQGGELCTNHHMRHKQVTASFTYYNIQLADRQNFLSRANLSPGQTPPL